MTFTVHCEMKDRWAETFISFLKNLQGNGEIGHSSLIGFFADGDGDFRPKFEFDGLPEDIEPGRVLLGQGRGECEVVFDAG